MPSPWHWAFLQKISTYMFIEGCLNSYYRFQLLLSGNTHLCKKDCFEQSRYGHSTKYTTINITCKSATLKKRYYCIRIYSAKIVGGDFFDCAPITKHEIGIIIAAITGHGVSSALIASLCKIAFLASRDVFINRQALLEKKINTKLQNKTADQFLTALCLYINTSTNTIVAASAGHPQCIIVDTHCYGYNKVIIIQNFTQ